MPSKSTKQLSREPPQPIAVLVPCHRVIKKDGSLSGCRWGAKRKRALLAREQRAVPFRLS